MEITEILSRIEQKIQDESYDRLDLLNKVNEGLGEIAARVQLPDLITNDKVTCEADTSSVSLPDDYFGYLIAAYNKDTKQSLTILDSLVKLKRSFPGLDQTGSVTHCVAKGSTLFFQGCPSSSEDVKLFYCSKPALFSASGDPLVYDPEEITYIPEHFQAKLLVTYAVKEVFNEIEDGLEDKKINWNTYNKLFEENLAKMTEFLGDQEDNASFVDTENDLKGMGFFSDNTYEDRI